MSKQQVRFLHNGLVASCALAALVLLASFYSIVSSAVDRAARHRQSGADAVVRSATALPARAAVRPGALLARADN